MNRIRTLFALIQSPEPAPPWSLTSALVAVIFAFVAMIVGSGVTLIWLGTASGAALAGWALGGLLIFLFVWQTRQRDLNALRLNPPQTPILFITFIAFGFALGLDLLGLAVTREFLPAPELQYLDLNAMALSSWVLAILFMVIVQPAAEELVFRGILQPALRNRIGAWGSILAAAVFSGGFHMLIYPLNTVLSLTPLWYGLISPLLQGILFGMVRASSKSTRAAIAAHAAFGLFAVVKLLMLAGS